MQSIKVIYNLLKIAKAAHHRRTRAVYVCIKCKSLIFRRRKAFGTLAKCHENEIRKSLTIYSLFL